MCFPENMVAIMESGKRVSVATYVVYSAPPTLIVITRDLIEDIMSRVKLMRKVYCLFLNVMIVPFPRMKVEVGNLNFEH